MRPISQHAVTIGGHKTSISLEPCFWEALRKAARDRRVSIGELLARIEADGPKNLSSAVRVRLFEGNLP
jgi:predicted DNA-binding ribbon-helix-helix protein